MPPCLVQTHIPRMAAFLVLSAVVFGCQDGVSPRFEMPREDIYIDTVATPRIETLITATLTPVGSFQPVVVQQIRVDSAGLWPIVISLKALPSGLYYWKIEVNMIGNLHIYGTYTRLKILYINHGWLEKEVELTAPDGASSATTAWLTSDKRQ